MNGLNLAGKLRFMRIMIDGERRKQVILVRFWAFPTICLLFLLFVYLVLVASDMEITSSLGR